MAPLSASGDSGLRQAHAIRHWPHLPISSARCNLRIFSVASCPIVLPFCDMDGRTLHDRQVQLRTRQCVQCGFDGQEMQPMPASNSLTACPQCGCDLNVRPPLSYAEMENIDLSTIIIVEPKPVSADNVDPSYADHWSHKTAATEGQSSKTLERWLLFIFLALLMVFASIVVVSNMNTL